MQYTVTINDKTITVNLNGYKGVAKCCETDTFNLQTGIELALERAKVAEANAKKAKSTAKPMGVMELVKALEKALPKGQVVVVGNGNGLTAEQKKWLHSLTGCTNESGYTENDLEEAYDEGYSDGEAHKEAEITEAYDEGYDEGYNKGRHEGYDEGYMDGHADGYDEGCEEGLDEDEIIEAVRNALRQ